MTTFDNLKVPRDAKQKRAWIKYQLELRGYSLADIAREAGCTRQSVQKAISRGSHRLERLIANKVQLTPQQIWPERYDRFGTPLRLRGRPVVMTAVNSTTSSPESIRSRQKSAAEITLLT